MSYTAKKTKLIDELYLIPHENRYLVYAPLKRIAFQANAQMVNFLCDLQEGSDVSAKQHESYEFLEELGFFEVDTPYPHEEYSGSPKPTGITLFLTTSCTLRCTYCYASAGDTPVRHMPLSIAKQGIDFIIQNAVELNHSHIEIAYHGGGEPSVNWRVLVDSLDYARRQADKFERQVMANLASNGILNQQQLQWITQNIQGVSLSYDGPVAQDQHRLTISGQGSNSQVVRSMRYFEAAEFPYGVRMTVTADQLPYLAESIEYICSQHKPAQILVEPSYNMGRWQNAASAETKQFVQNFRDAQKIARIHGHELLFSAARVGTITNHFCGVSQDNFSLSTSGNVSACYEVFSEDSKNADVFFYGKFNDQSKQYQFDVERLNRLRNLAVQNREYCQNCFAKWSCAGDCYNKFLSENQEQEFSGSQRCFITQELSKDQIIHNIEQSGGYIWRGREAEDYE